MTEMSQFWQNLVRVSLQTEEDEIGCQECMDVLDQYVDLLIAGKKPTEVMPELEQHLAVCGCCYSEFEALLIALHAAVGPGG